MNQRNPFFSSVRNIDNSRQWLPISTTILVIFSLVSIIWFFRGGSFRLYASAFFGLYSFTGQIWLSVILIGIFQNIIFLPLRIIGLRLATSFEQFENELETYRSDREQYLVFTKKIRQGSPEVVYYVFSFILNFIAFFSAGRIFLIDFYNQPLDPKLLYHFIPYPQYPLEGTLFYFPFVKVTQTFALSWSSIGSIWFGIILVIVALRILWRFIGRLFLSANRQILSLRINYNRLLFTVGGFIGTLFLISIYLFRHLPSGIAGLWLVADLTRQNTTMNFITAVATFLTTIHAGYNRHRLVMEKALAGGATTSDSLLVFSNGMRQSVKNAIILGLGAFFITNQIPCAFELSVATFELLYVLSPYFFDRFLGQINSSVSPTSEPSTSTG